MAGDNQRFIFVSESLDNFRVGLRLVFKDTPSGLAEAWALWKPKRSEYEKDRPEEMLGVCAKEFLAFYWHYESGAMHPFPSKVGAETAGDFAWEWLSKLDYGKQPDHDGDNGKGFIMFNDAWGHIGGNHYGIVAIGPAWAMYGK